MKLNGWQRTHHGEIVSRRRLMFRASLLGGPALAWLMIFFVLPVLSIVIISFLSRGELSTVERPFTLENFQRLAGFGFLGFESVYPFILLRSLVLGFATAVFCLAAGLPLAFFIAKLPARWKTVALTLVVIPFWINLLIRTYAWQILLAPEGWLAQLASALHLVGPGEALYPNVFAVYLCMACDYLPFMVLPLYASVEKLDWTLVEAARDLGANARAAFRHAILPQIKPGMIAGLLLVFLPAMGQFVIPDLLGGAKTALLGNALQQQFGPGLDWPFGAAIAVASLIIVLFGFWLFERELNIL
jgi:spermidine/putrescine transport system permease protein